MNKEQMRCELNTCLSEQGFDWYNEIDFWGLALLGLIEMHKRDVEEIIDKTAQEIK